MEVERGDAAAPKRILWTRDLEDSLLDLEKWARKEKLYLDALERQWHSQNPTLPSKGSALCGKSAQKNKREEK